MRIEPMTQLPQLALPAPAPAPEQAPAPVMPRRPDLIVLSAAAYRALISAPRTAASLAGTFDVSVANASGRLHIAPGAMDGVVSVSIDLFHVPTWPEPPGPIRRLHLTAQLRSSWVERVTPDEAANSDQAQQLADAVTKLAQIPGQQTVAITAIPEAA